MRMRQRPARYTVHRFVLLFKFHLVLSTLSGQIGFKSNKPQFNLELLLCVDEMRGLNLTMHFQKQTLRSKLNGKEEAKRRKHRRLRTSNGQIEVLTIGRRKTNKQQKKDST